LALDEHVGAAGRGHVAQPHERRAADELEHAADGGGDEGARGHGSWEGWGAFFCHGTSPMSTMLHAWMGASPRRSASSMSASLSAPGFTKNSRTPLALI